MRGVSIAPLDSDRTRRTLTPPAVLCFFLTGSPAASASGCDSMCIVPFAFSPDRRVDLLRSMVLGVRGKGRERGSA